MGSFYINQVGVEGLSSRVGEVFGYGVFSFSHSVIEFSTIFRSSESVRSTLGHLILIETIRGRGYSFTSSYVLRSVIFYFAEFVSGFIEFSGVLVIKSGNGIITSNTNLGFRENPESINNITLIFTIGFSFYYETVYFI